MAAGWLQDGCRIAAGWLQDGCKMAAGSVQDGCRMAAWWLQDCYRIAAGWLQDCYRIAAGWLQDCCRMAAGSVQDGCRMAAWWLFFFHCSFLINLPRLVHDPKLSVRLYLGFSKVFFDEIIIFWLTSIVLLKFSFCFSNSTTTAAGPPAGCPTICIALYWCTSETQRNYLFSQG